MIKSGTPSLRHLIFYILTINQYRLHQCSRKERSTQKYVLEKTSFSVPEKEIIRLT